MFRINDKHLQQSLFETSRWMNPRVREKLEKSWAPLFYEHVFCNIDEEPFAVLYGDTGKPNFPVNILLSLEYVKHIKNCNDLELLDYFRFDVLVSHAVGIRALGEMDLAPRTLYYFRERLYQYSIDNPDKCDLLFNQFISLLKDFAQKAAISFGEQRTDTTLFMSNIKKAGRISLAYDVLVKAVKAIPEEKRTDKLIAVLEDKFKTNVLYHTKSQDGDSKLTLLLQLCNEALLILESQPEMLQSEEVRILNRFLKEQSITHEESGKLLPKPKGEIESGSLQSAHDEDATYRTKGDVGQSGYVLEISETCDKENPFQLITDYAVEANNVSDSEILQGRLDDIKENTGCTDMYVDGGFHSENVHKTAEEAGIKIHLTNMTGTEPVQKLPVTEFDIDGNTNVINRCPAGFVPTHAGIKSGQTTAHFSHEVCGNCEKRGMCHSKRQVKDCVVRISLKSLNASRLREIMKANKKENVSKRAGIEGSNSALKSKGLKKLRVRGKVKSTIVCGLKVTAQNIKRFVKFLQGGYKPKITTQKLNGITMPNCA